MKVRASSARCPRHRAVPPSSVVSGAVGWSGRIDQQLDALRDGLWGASSEDQRKALYQVASGIGGRVA
eukprot:4069178-Alexandrium_andersonii.AAC.1